MEDKYIIKDLCDVLINGQEVILNNNFEGKWIKIPIECYEVINYSIENSMPLNQLIRAFKNEEDQDYFKKIIKNLDAIGILSTKEIKKVRLGFMPKVVFTLTNRCNLRCDYCCQDSKIEEKDVLTTEEIKLALDRIVKLNPQRITLTGGEPLLRDDFFEILEYLKTIYDEKIILCTNATLITKENIKIIARDIYAIEISLDGFDEASCSEVRGKGVFSKVMNTVKELQKNNMDKIALSMVVGKHNSHNLNKFYKLNNDLGTKPRLRAFSKSGRGNFNYTKYLDEDMILYKFEDKFEDINDLRGDHCQAGRTQIGIAHDGNVYVCPVLQSEEFRICNILEKDLDIRDIIFNREAEALKNFNNLKPKNRKECKDCKVNIFCIGCPEVSYLLSQNKKAFDLHCEFTKRKLLKKIW